VYALRTAIPGLAVFDFRMAVPDTGASTVRRLGHAPVAARDELLSRLQERSERAGAPHRRARGALRAVRSA
jgi:hypothetical protein